VGRKPKKGVTQTERLFVRYTADLKEQLKQASQVSSAGTITDYIQGLVEPISPLVIKLNEGEISPQEFKAMVGEIVYVLASPSPSYSPSPEPPEGEDVED